MTNALRFSLSRFMFGAMAMGLLFLDAHDAVAQIQATGTLDVARKQALLEALQRYASSIAS